MNDTIWACGRQRYNRVLGYWIVEMNNRETKVWEFFASTQSKAESDATLDRFSIVMEDWPDRY
jgi:hypothetical protein